MRSSKRLLRPDDEQPRRVARLRRAERDAVLGQVEIEQVDAHGGGLRAAAVRHGAYMWITRP